MQESLLPGIISSAIAHGAAALILLNGLPGSGRAASAGADRIVVEIVVSDQPAATASASPRGTEQTGPGRPDASRDASAGPPRAEPRPASDRLVGKAAAPLRRQPKRSPAPPAARAGGAVNPVADPAPTSAVSGSAPPGGSSVGGANGLRVRSWLEKYRRYPPLARRRGLTGTVRLALSIGGDGSLRAAKIVVSSGSSLLDDAALEMASRAAPFPIDGAPSPGSTFEVQVPVVFRLS